MYYLGVDSTLENELEDFGYNLNPRHQYLSCQNLCQLAKVPESIWHTLREASKLGKLTELNVDFSDNLPYLSEAVNASVEFFDAMDIKVKAKINAKYSSDYKDRISLIPLF